MGDLPVVDGLLAGQAASLLSAVMWAIAVAMFHQSIAEYGARAVNLAKSAVGCVLLGITMLVLGQVSTLGAASPRDLIWIGLSGVLGLAIGDTALFAAVGRIGPPRALLLQTTTPVFTAILAYLLGGARPATGQMIGGALILIGVIVVVSHRATMPLPTRIESSSDETTVTETTAAETTAFEDASGIADRRALRIGLGLGLLGALGQAGGIVMAKEAMTALPIVTASFLRMFVGGFGLAVILLVAGRLGATARALGSTRGFVQLVPPSILGTYLAFLLMMAGLAWAPAAIAAVLLATVPIWSLLIEARTSRRRIQPRELVGTLLAVGGVALVAAIR